MKGICHLCLLCKDLCEAASSRARFTRRVAASLALLTRISKNVLAGLYGTSILCADCSSRKTRETVHGLKVTGYSSKGTP